MSTSGGSAEGARAAVTCTASPSLRRRSPPTQQQASVSACALSGIQTGSAADRQPLLRPHRPANRTDEATAPIPEPEMIAREGGRFAMGSNEDTSEKPVRQVTVKPFAMGKFPRLRAGMERLRCGKSCGFTGDRKDEAPVTNVSWNDARAICRVAR